MKRSIVETLLGAAVLAVAGYFLFFSYSTANVGSPDGFRVYADFSKIGGLKAGDSVQVSGVKVGKVESVSLTPDTYLARVQMDIDPSIKLPTDTAALISSESLLGGRYLSLEPGADEEMIPNNGRVEYTQAPANLEELLGKFIFSMSENKDKGQAPTAPADLPDIPAAEEAPEAAPEAAPADEAPTP